MPKIIVAVTLKRRGAPGPVARFAVRVNRVDRYYPGTHDLGSVAWNPHVAELAVALDVDDLDADSQDLAGLAVEALPLPPWAQLERGPVGHEVVLDGHDMFDLCGWLRDVSARLRIAAVGSA